MDIKFEVEGYKFNVRSSCINISNIDIRPKTINNLIKCDNYSSISHNVNYDWV